MAGQFLSVRGTVLVVLCSILGACSSNPFPELDFTKPETVVTYEPKVVGAPTDEVESLMEESLLIFRRKDQGAQSVAFLRRRARGDIDTAQKILRSYGWYNATVDVDVTQTEPGPGGKVGNAVATIKIDPGKRFILANHDITLTDTGDAVPKMKSPQEYGSPIGKPAVAKDILSAERQMVADLRGEGRPYAKRTGRDAVADLENASLDVETTIDTGQLYRFGPVSFEGAPDVENDYLRTYIPWDSGDVVDTALLAAFQRKLMDTRLFRSGRVNIPDNPPEGEVAPVKVVLEEAPPRTVKAGVRYDTYQGPGVRFGFEHRNLWRENEQIQVTLDTTLTHQILDTTFRKPQYGIPGQDLVSTFEARHVDDDAYNELGGTLTLGLERQITDRWKAGLGVLGEYSKIEDEGEKKTAYLGGIPFFAASDRTDSLLDPTTGERFRFDVTPFAGTYGGDLSTFLKLEANGSIYRPIYEKREVVVAARGRIGSIVSGTLDDVPPTRRFYSGGGGSVRGYKQKFIGPLDANNDPIGGRSVMEAGGEIRGKVWGDLGLAAFVGAGTVSTSSTPQFENGIQVAAGTGIRYYSPIGPIRLDVAFPLNPREVDDTFQFYISIGQAF